MRSTTLSCLAGAVGAVGRREVRACAGAGRAPRRRAASTSRVEGLLLVAERPALGHERLGALGVALAAPLPDLLREHLDRAPGGRRAAVPSARCCTSSSRMRSTLRRRVAAAPGEPGADGVGFGAEAADVEHGPDGSGAPSLGWEAYRGRGGQTVADGVSDVWFRVTDLEVASGSGCVVTTTDGDRVPRLLERHRRHEHRATATRTWWRPSRPRRPGSSTPRSTCTATPASAELAGRLAAIAPPPDRHVLLRQLRRRGHRVGGEAGQAGHRSPERDRVPGQLPRPHPPGHGDDDVEDRLPSRPRPAAVRRVRRAVPQGRGRGRRVPRRRSAPAAQPDRARGDRRHAHRAGARRGRLRARADRVPPGPRGDLPRARHPLPRRRGADRLRAHRHDVLRRAARRPSRRRRDGQGPRVRASRSPPSGPRPS